MKLSVRFVGLAVAAGAALTLAADPAAAQEKTRKPLGAFIDRFDRLDDKVWYVADQWGIPGAFFDTEWRRDAIDRTGDGLTYTLRELEGGQKGYAGANVQKHGWAHYGRYETIMSAAKGPGIVSAFFTYTGEHYGDKHDEIDFEFLGKDTTEVQLNYYVGGRGGHEVYVPLGYDASEVENLYAFEWEPGVLRWYVGDKLVHEVRRPENELPTTPSLIFSQVWVGGPPTRGWLGRPVELMDPDLRVRCISYRPLGETGGAMCSDGYEAVNTAEPAQPAG